MKTETDNIHFDDPELKKALARALPKTAAPASLRLSIERGLDEISAPAPEPLTHPNPWQISHWLPTHRRLAVAAAIAGLGLGIGLFLASDNFDSGHQHSTAVAMNDPVIVQGALVRHDEMQQSLASGGEQFRRSLFTVPEVREQLSREASLPIPQADLTSAGWQLAGAKPCRMGNCCGAQLFYTRGQQTMSAFVFPAGRISPEMVAACGKDGRLTAVRPLPNATLLVVARCPAGKLSQDEVEQAATLLLNGR